MYIHTFSFFSYIWFVVILILFLGKKLEKISIRPYVLLYVNPGIKNALFFPFLLWLKFGNLEKILCFQFNFNILGMSGVCLVHVECMSGACYLIKMSYLYLVFINSNYMLISIFTPLANNIIVFYINNAFAL